MTCRHHTFSDLKTDYAGSEVLTKNAQGLVSTVSKVLDTTEAATITVPREVKERLGLVWVKCGKYQTL